MRDGGIQGDGGRMRERVNGESEVEEGGGRAGEERERFVFMLVVTEVFIAPPTHGDKEREMGEGGCVAQKERERAMEKTEVFRKRVRGRQKERSEEQQEGDITEGMFC